MKTAVTWAIIACIVALAYVVTARIAVRHVQRRLRARCARLVSDQPAHDKHHPGLPFDGNPLTRPERERLDQIKRGMRKTASEPGRRM